MAEVRTVCIGLPGGASVVQIKVYNNFSQRMYTIFYFSTDQVVEAFPTTAKENIKTTITNRVMSRK